MQRLLRLPVDDDADCNGGRRSGPAGPIVPQYPGGYVASPAVVGQTAWTGPCGDDPARSASYDDDGDGRFDEDDPGGNEDCSGAGVAPLGGRSLVRAV
jgi:hypothetical protein